MSRLHLEKLPITPPSAQAVDWLIGELDWGNTLRSWIPTGFESYVRILHPAYIIIGKEWETREVPAPWSAVSQWSGKRLHATTHIRDLMIRPDGHDWRRQGEGGEEPHQGEMDGESLSRLFAHLSESAMTPDDIWMLIWFGYAGPADRSWFVSCDINASSTYVGGSKELIDQILKDPLLETFAANLDDPYGALYVSSTVVENDDGYVPPRKRFKSFLRHDLFRSRGRSNSSAYVLRKLRWWEWWMKP